MENPGKDLFIAVAVGKGDAFFLKKYGLSILVDGGMSIKRFRNQFRRVTNIGSLDILVCTHNDADHAIGVLGILKSKVKVGEVWLPGSWTYRLQDLLVYPDQFINELIRDIEELSEIDLPLSKQITLSNLGDTLTKYEEIIVRGSKPKDYLEQVFNSASKVDRISDVLPIDITRLCRLGKSYERAGVKQVLKYVDKKLRLMIECISAADLIREIALAAHKRKIPIRWFEYHNSSRSGGRRGALEPVNSHEISAIQRTGLSDLSYLALSVSNSYSLVFLSPKSNKSPGVLFTADSDLCFSQAIPWHTGMIITAPHHGAETNHYAYERFQKEAKGNCKPIWVRSDGKFPSHPGSSFLSVRGQRYCTWCNVAKFCKQNVELVTNRSRWVVSKPIVRSCQCV